MSILRVANVHFEATGSNRIDYPSTDTVSIVANGGRVNVSPGWANVTGNVVATGEVRDSIGNLRDVPLNSQTAAYILQSSDQGKIVSITTGGITVPNAVFSQGDNITIYNSSFSNQTITPASDVTMYFVGTANTASKTLAQRGLATVVCVAANTFVITGGGLT